MSWFSRSGPNRQKSMSSDNVVDFEQRREAHLHRQREAKVEALKSAFRKARGESDSGGGSKGKRRKKKKK